MHEALKGPRGSFLFGNLPDFGRNPIDFLERCHREYGDMVGLRFFQKKVCFTSDPVLIEMVLTTRARDFRKTVGYRTPFMRRLFGQGLLTSEGEVWSRQRRLAQPAFHKERIASYAGIITDFTQELSDEWLKGGERQIHTDMMTLTTKVVTKSLFTADVPQQIHDLNRGSGVVMKRFTSQWSGTKLLLSFLPSAEKRRFLQVMDRLDAYIYGVIEDRRRHGDAKDDLLSMFLKARDDEGKGMSDQQLRDELITLMAAGLDTTALALSWALYLLALNPRIQEEAAKETKATLQGNTPTIEDFTRLKALQNIVKESMRLYPPAWTIGREALVDVEWKGHLISRGTSVLMSQWIMHRDERFFKAPEQFVPSRWNHEESIPKFAYFPFGGGPRTCIGHAFATMEAVLVLAMLLPRFKVSCLDGYRVEPWPSITLQPKGGIQLIIQSRMEKQALA
jgi:cytochrome P450